MSKLTSVEWLRDKIFEEFRFTFSDNILNEAKEMHKQEIIDAYATVITKYNGVKSWTKIHDEEGEKYYNETYLNNQIKTDKYHKQ